MRAEGFRYAVLLGMGGSSLAPEVFSAILGRRRGALELHVLDSTDPAAVLAVEAAVDLERTLFIVASKSGRHDRDGELPRLLLRASAGSLWRACRPPLRRHHRRGHLAAAAGARAGASAPSSSTRATSAAGTRRSVFFGLVPAALLGVDLERLLDGVAPWPPPAGRTCPPRENPALRLGAALGELALAGRDKLTLVCEPPLAPLGAWVEQLVAESTGKEGTGILPVDLEPLGSPELYGDDRVFCASSCGRRRALPRARLEALAAAGHPVLEHELADAYGIGGEMLRWELATAAAGACSASTPSTSPTSRRARTTRRRCWPAVDAADGALPASRRGEGGGAVRLPVGDEGLPGALRAFLAQAAPGDYVALQAYVAPGAAVWDALQALRLQLRDGLRHRHDPGLRAALPALDRPVPQGRAEPRFVPAAPGARPRDVAIPGQPYGFGVLKRAQARGDLAALRAHGCRALRVCLGDDVPAGLTRLAGTRRRGAPATRSRPPHSSGSVGTRRRL